MYFVPNLLDYIYINKYSNIERFHKVIEKNTMVQSVFFASQ